MAKEGAPYMPWFGREFYADENVQVMTLEEEGCYLRLLWNCWQEGSVPADTAKLAAVCKNMAARRFDRDIWPALSGLFSSGDDGRLTHHKVETLRDAKEARRVKCSEAGKRGMETRWGIDKVPYNDLTKTRLGVDNESISSEYRVPNTEYRIPENLNTHRPSDDGRPAGDSLELASPPKQKPVDEVRLWFDGNFWPMYPRKVAKPAALRAARHHGKTAAERAVIMDCIGRTLTTLQEQFRTDGDFRPYPATWLNQTPWLDTAEAGLPTAAVSKSSGIDAALQELYNER